MSTRKGGGFYGYKLDMAVCADTGLPLAWQVRTASNNESTRWIKASRLHPLVPRETPRWRKLYKGRAAVEREFGRLKNDWGSRRCGFVGLDRVRLHADLTILAKLPCALARARAVPLAA